MALAHEVAHIRRQDWTFALCMRCVRDLFWWLPPVWLAEARHRMDAEQSADALAIEATSANRVEYGRMLLRAFARPTAVGALGISSSARPAAERLAELGRQARSSRFATISLVCAAIVAFPSWRLAEREGMRVAQAAIAKPAFEAVTPSVASKRKLSPRVASRAKVTRSSTFHPRAISSASPHSAVAPKSATPVAFVAPATDIALNSAPAPTPIAQPRPARVEREGSPTSEVAYASPAPDVDYSRSAPQEATPAPAAEAPASPLQPQASSSPARYETPRPDSDQRSSPRRARSPRAPRARGA